MCERPMLYRPPETRARWQTRMSAAAHSMVVDAPQTAPAKPTPMATWPQRPDPSILSETIPLFFISRDSDGFWITCEADFRIGGIFLMPALGLALCAALQRTNTV